MDLNNNLILIGLPSVLLLMSLVIGLVWFSPELRASFLVWRGNDHKAGQLIESLIDQDPARLHLYPKLARIYYLGNRRDKRALKTFELILRYKVPFEWRAELYTVVAKHYIIEGRKDTEAIRFIERAVDKELKRMRNFAI